jgi:pimeloyl-ACP methyl ester carboxylesterase
VIRASTISAATTDGSAPSAKVPAAEAVVEGRITRPGGRVVAWAESGALDGRPVLRIPGTPSSRFAIRLDSLWSDRGIRMIVTERPGFGASTWQPGRRFEDHADDLVAILDELHLDRVPALAGSGGAPYGLALAAAHPDRVAALAVVVGAVPIQADEAAEMIGLNAEGHRLAASADRAGMVALLDPVRTAILRDPLASFRAVMETAPASDQAIMGDPAWQAMTDRNLREAMRSGVDGWVDESMLMFGGWSGLDPSQITTTVTWWQGDLDRNVPLISVRRLLERLPHARLVEWRESGHLTPYLLEGEILDELLDRAGRE